MKIRKLLIIASFFFCTSIMAQSENVLVFQGELADQNHQFLNGTYAIHFSIWSTQTGGTSALWSQQMSSVTVDKGFLSVLLGGTAAPFPTDLFSASIERYLEVRVNDGSGEETLSPRMRITSSLYTVASEESSGECPDGMVKVNYFCIDTTRGSATTYHSAKRACYDNGKRLCKWHEAQDACEAGLLDINNGATLLPEWNADYAQYSRICVWGVNKTSEGLPYCFGLASLKYVVGDTISYANYRCCK